MLKEKFRKYIIQEKIGLLTKLELIKLADNYILENDDFPYWVQKISMDEDLYNEELLDLVLNPINEIDAQLIADFLLNSYKARKMNMHDIEKISRNICNTIDTDSDIYYFFDWITDEVHLIEEGVKSKKNFEEGLTETLESIIKSNRKSV